jgi:hypothetical protein
MKRCWRYCCCPAGPSDKSCHAAQARQWQQRTQIHSLAEQRTKQAQLQQRLALQQQELLSTHTL